MSNSPSPAQFRHGYFTGSGYTFGAYSDPSPERLYTLCLLRSHRPPAINGPFRLIELGCGQGFHLCTQAANYPEAHFLGIDLIPDHIAHGRSLAAAAGLSNVTFVQADFLALEEAARIAADIEWGNFDFVVAHGIFGWVSPHVGASLLRLAEVALRPGGVLYLSYNSLPGWLSALPFQHAVRTFQEHRDDGLQSLQSALKLFESLKGVNAQLFAAQPTLAHRLEGISGRDPAYLLHEYNHSNWQPLYANQVIEQARHTGLHYLGSAVLIDNFDGYLPAPFRALLEQYTDPPIRELVRDLLMNRAFRPDVYVKGRDPLWPSEAESLVGEVGVRRLMSSEDLVDKSAFDFRIGVAEIQGNREWFEKLVQVISDGDRSISELRENLVDVTLPELLQNLTLLLSKNQIALVPPARDISTAQRFNAHIARCVVLGAPYRAVVSPVSGNIQYLSDVELIALHEVLNGCGMDRLAEAIEAALVRLGRELRLGGKYSGEDSRAELARFAEDFNKVTIPHLRRLGVIPEG